MYCSLLLTRSLCSCLRTVLSGGLLVGRAPDIHACAGLHILLLFIFNCFVQRQLLAALSVLYIMWFHLLREWNAISREGRVTTVPGKSASVHIISSFSSHSSRLVSTW